jgi:PAS domain S-box-containing protein
MERKGKERRSLTTLVSEFHHHAKERVRKKERSPLSGTDVQQLIRELEVRQDELKTQNEELQNALAEMAELRDRYVELYDFAPIGYFKLDEKGIIIEANLTGSRLLGLDRSVLIGRPFSRYIHSDSGNAFYLDVKQVFRSGEKEFCELQIKKENGISFAATLESIAVGQEGSIGLRVAIIDISNREKKEEQRHHGMQ